ncbi:disease resistance protein RUN1-like [Eucalyptus grandis]|uniref:disease resistance protein RUN1-like n=1 Tax=Eucalyptus grandis TaxID=71139 RepID=UPI00192EE647|nr:disease resistance protein RUN1-like [Eucalyptus grandis]
MANSEIGTSTSNTLRDEYQVFLSFRGPDTRRGFTNVLHQDLVYAGIRVFIDNEELRKGERISGNLLQAIDHSKLYIPIFSKNYASSHWCLRELAKMVENNSKSKEDGKENAILPIFYDVKPDDVKLKTPLYRKAISNLKQTREDHEKKFSSKDIKTWQQALKEAGGITGWELEKYPGYVKLIQEVVEEVVVRLKIRQRSSGSNIANIDDGINKIEETICNKKMLIVLDDVDEANQIQKLIRKKSLYPGTRILVTTRDKSILNIREFKYQFEDYEMVRSSKDDALKLFSRRAFNDDSPPADYHTLSKGIVSTADGLPLALEAIGSSLFGEEEREIWEEWLEKLKKTPHEDVLGKLKISYDALNPYQQQIFLDVACFFIGENKTNPMYVWKDCELSPEISLKVLIKRCMIKVLDNDIFEMHDQFRDLGRVIAKKERTRLWDKDDIICELRSTEIKESVQALHLQTTNNNRTTITAEQLRRFPHLKFLWLSNVVCEGEFTGCLSKLKWIILMGNTPTNLGLENVVVMNFRFSNPNKDEIRYLIKGAMKLKVLTLENNGFICGTPTFLECSVLEKLTICHYPSLKKIDHSIGKLRLLTDLNIESCVELENLPEQIGELQNLRHLSLNRCHSLSELPDSISKLESLMKLDISCTNITRLPDSIGRLRSLSYANVSWTPIAQMPGTMSKLLRLQTLKLEHRHRIKEWPELPRSLTTLRLISASLLTVPNLSNLTNLVELFLSNDFDDRLCISSVIPIGELRWIGRLSKLSKLHFCLLNVHAPTTELGSLSLLKELTLFGLYFRTLKQLPSNLIVLKLYHTQLKYVHLGGLPMLEKLRENEVYEQPDVPSLEVLCAQSRCFLPKDPGYNEVRTPELFDHSWGKFPFLNSLKMLREFHMERCQTVEVIDFVSLLESLEKFTVRGCCSLRRIKGLSNLKKLRRLHIESCWRLRRMEGIHELEFLQQFRSRGSVFFVEIFDASSSKIPNECQMDITFNCNFSGNWESFREMIRIDKKQMRDFGIYATVDSETLKGILGSIVSFKSFFFSTARLEEFGCYVRLRRLHSLTPSVAGGMGLDHHLIAEEQIVLRHYFWCENRRALDMCQCAVAYAVMANTWIL